MKRNFLLGLLLVASAIGLVAAGDEATRVQVADTAVSLVPPPGFTVSDLFRGFSHEATGSSLMVMELDGSITEVRAGLTPEALAERGATLLATEEIRIAGRTADLLLAGQEQDGVDFRKWVVIFGSEEVTVMILAIYPESEAATMKETLKAAILTADWHRTGMSPASTDD